MESAEGGGGGQERGLNPSASAHGMRALSLPGPGIPDPPRETVKLPISWAAGRTAQLMGVHSRGWPGLLRLRSWKLGGRELFC